MVVRCADGTYALDRHRPKSIGRLKGFNGHFGILARAYTYIRMHGPDGLRTIAETAVLNANYLRVLLKDLYDVAYDRGCMHDSSCRAVARSRPTACVPSTLPSV